MFCLREVSYYSVFIFIYALQFLPQLRSGHERGDNMRAWCGFATLCAIGLLGGDVALLIVNLVCYLREE